MVIGGFRDKCYASLTGLSRCLALWWNEDVDVCIIKSSSNIIHVHFNSQSLGVNWYTYLIYGYCRSQLWVLQSRSEAQL